MIDLIALYFISGVALASAIVIFLRNLSQFNRREKTAFSYLFISFFFWVSSNAVSDIVKDYSVALFGAQVAIIFALNLATAVYQISTVFPIYYTHYPASLRVQRIVIPFAIIFSIILWVTRNSTQNVALFEVQEGGAALFIPGPLYLFVFAYAFLVLSMGFIHWMRRYSQYTPTQKEQVKLLSVSLILVLISMIFGFAVFPAYSLTQYTPLVFAFIALFLFQLQQNVLNKNATINIAQISKRLLLYIILVIIVQVLFEVLMIFHSNGISQFSMFLLLALLFVGIERVNRYFENVYLDRGIDREVIKFIDRTSSVLKVQSVISLLQLTLRKILQDGVTRVHLLIDTNHSEFEDQVFNLWTSMKEHYVMTPERLVEELVNARLYNMKDSSRIELLENGYIRMLNEDIYAILFLSNEGGLQGFVTIKRAKNVVFDKETLVQLSALMQNASTNLSRAILYMESQQFTKSLEKKVVERTKEINDARADLEEKNKQIKNAFTQLTALDKAKNDFISMASHQLKTPISIARGYLAMLQEGDFGHVNEKQVEPLAKTISSIVQLNTIVEDILNVARVEEGRLVLNYERANIVELSSRAVDLLSQKAKLKNLDIRMVTEYRELDTFIDKNKLYEVIYNLIDNAINYTPTGSVQVRIDRTTSRYSISVIDTGIGIPRKEQQSIFKKFARASNAKSIRPDGSGIGLYLAKVITEAHRGKISFKSIQGKGSTFTITLPILKKMP